MAEVVAHSHAKGWKGGEFLVDSLHHRKWAGFTIAFIGGRGTFVDYAHESLHH